MPQILPDPNTTKVIQNRSIMPLLSTAALTTGVVLGLVIIKQNPTPSSTPKSSTPIAFSPSPTAAPVSIYNYLLSSQKSFSEAISVQSTDPFTAASLINQAILSATDAIKQYPTDYRGYDQRAKIYEAISSSGRQYQTAAIADLEKASQLNSSSSDLTRRLAIQYAALGDGPSTVAALSSTVIREPTKASNYYDLAKIQQQLGDLVSAKTTYSTLLPLLSDPAEQTTIKSEIDALQSLIAQAPARTNTSTSATPSPALRFTEAPSLLKADAGSQLIVAAPDTEKPVEVSSTTQSNALSGTAVLPAGSLDQTIQNQNITSQTPVYVTAIKGGKNINLYIKSKSRGEFTFGIDSPISEEITIKWWVLE